MGDDAIKNAAAKAANEAKELAKDAAAVGKLIASAGADVSAWWRLIKRWIGRLIKLLVACALIFIQMLAATTTANAETNCDTSTPGAGAAATTTATAQGWSSKQMNNAATIIQTGVNLHVPPRGIIIALATAMQESQLTNLGDLGAKNDHDSLGLFQQRPSSGWGTPAQVTDPVYASTKFYKKLLTIDGWEKMPLTQAAQKVQISAYPDAYAKWEQNATNVYTKITGSANYVNGGVNAPAVDDATLNQACDISASANTSGSGPAPAAFDKLGNPHSVEEAIAWATKLANSGKTVAPDGWVISGHCDHIVALAFGWANSGENTAQDHWDDIPANLKHPGKDGIPPRGAVVFWDTKSAANHIAISLGDGRVLTTDSPKGHEGIATLAHIDGWGPRIGWAAPAFPNMSKKV